MTKSDVAICAPVHTAIGTFNSTLKDRPAPSLGASGSRGCLETAGLTGSDIGIGVMDHLVQVDAKTNPPRQTMLEGGLPSDVPAMTSNAASSRCRLVPLTGSPAHWKPSVER